jgi:hypothetical protein
LDARNRLKLVCGGVAWWGTRRGAVKKVMAGLGWPGWTQKAIREKTSNSKPGKLIK